MSKKLSIGRMTYSVLFTPSRGEISFLVDNKSPNTVYVRVYHAEGVEEDKSDMEKVSVPSMQKRNLIFISLEGEFEVWVEMSNDKALDYRLIVKKDKVDMKFSSPLMS